MCPRPVVRRIVEMRKDGRKLQSIADELNRDEIPTATGKPEWKRPHVHRILGTAVASKLRDEMTSTEDTSIFGGELFSENGGRQAS
ncbi:recombinase family protein [Rhodococcus qingshengii]|uniref:recombinase family protein n=2 Tax=Nocardiaceae TaxID=85025 RepID=UPI002278A9AA|nr:recombinase family protein [Rhodococcus qingshengii]